MSEHGKMLCAVKNSTKYRSWIYNVFLGHNKKEEKDHGQQKINWLMKLDEKEIEILKDKGCEIVILNYNNSVKKEDKFKEGFTSLLNLFESLMKNQQTKNKIRDLLTNNDGRPSEDYKNIMRTKDYLKEDNNEQ